MHDWTLKVEHFSYTPPFMFNEGGWLCCGLSKYTVLSTFIFIPFLANQVALHLP